MSDDKKVRNCVIVFVCIFENNLSKIGLHIGIKLMVESMTPANKF